ncbi:Propanediol utilization protein PduA [Vibrio celticus]|uniref:Propanediol utilization protein PduA n=1 Tax=Vibrio celticus TaxID=446372 RepID=A0A1C3JEE7_9VIBR|nr:Propanediol utilization protein PduA [Vibrio celticus]
MSMSDQSLGLIETVGLAAAIEAADAAIKSANVELLGYESAKGNGLHTVKLVGDVGAVNAAVDAGVAAASRIGKVYAYKVIARTAEGLEAAIIAGDNVKSNAVQEPQQKKPEQASASHEDALVKIPKAVVEEDKATSKKNASAANKPASPTANKRAAANKKTAAKVAASATKKPQ